MASASSAWWARSVPARSVAWGGTMRSPRQPASRRVPSAIGLPLRRALAGDEKDREPDELAPGRWPASPPQAAYRSMSYPLARRLEQRVLALSIAQLVGGYVGVAT